MIKDIMDANDNVAVGAKEMEILKEHFPACFHNGSFDVGRLKEYLKDKINVTEEGYELRFLGKNYARLLASLDTTTVIVPDEEHNSLPENKDSKNIYISGDNLDALKHLLKSYAGCIKCIYIDPPYNTGSDDFVYKDSFDFTAEELASKLSISEEQAGRVLDLTRRGSATHSAWLMFMLPRLLLARDLLSKDGVIFISIDDNEQSNLKLLCDDVFGEENLLGTLILKTATDNNAMQINTEHEYMVCYAKRASEQGNWCRTSAAAKKIMDYYHILERKTQDIGVIQSKLREWININKQDLPQVVHYNNVDEKGIYSSSSNSSNPHPGGYDFDILHPITKKACPKPENGWRWTEETFQAYVDAGEVEWGKDETTQPHIKKRIETASEFLRSLIYEDNRASTLFLTKLFDGQKVFDNPKPHNVLYRLLDFVTDKESIVLDFFSGSATTAHAVLSLNASDEGNRKFIAVQLPEDLDIKMSKLNGNEKAIVSNAINVLDRKGHSHTLDYIGFERIKSVAHILHAENPLFHGDLGFKHFTLQEPASQSIEKMERFDPRSIFGDTTLADEFGVPTILTTWLVRDGYGLTPDVKTLNIAGYEAYYIDRHLYIINPHLSNEAVASLLDLYQSDAGFNPQNIAIYGYALSWRELQGLKDSLRVIRDGEKNMRINFDVRY